VLDLRNGEKLIFHTKPETVATVLGRFTDHYAILYAPDGTVNTAEVRQLPFAMLKSGIEEGLLRRAGDPVKTPKAKKTKKAPSAVVPPWAKT